MTRPIHYCFGIGGRAVGMSIGPVAKERHHNNDRDEQSQPMAQG
jgi:hypothetical protein